MLPIESVMKSTLSLLDVGKRSEGLDEEKAGALVEGGTTDVLLYEELDRILVGSAGGGNGDRQVDSKLKEC